MATYGHSGAEENSSLYTASADYTTSYDEVYEITQEIEARVGPKSTVVVALVTNDAKEKSREACSIYEPGQVFIETADTYGAQISNLGRVYEDGTPPSRTRLVLVVSPAFETCRINIPGGFLKVEVIACWKKRRYVRSGETLQERALFLDDASTYCDIPLGIWAVRTDRTRHELTTGHGVEFEVFDDVAMNRQHQQQQQQQSGVQGGPRQLTSGSDVDAAAAAIAERVEGPDAMDVPPESARSLPWLDVALGGASALLGVSVWSPVQGVRVSVHGIHISCGPYSAAGLHKAGVGGRGEGDDTMAVRGGAAAGGAVAANYFIPWRKVANWLFDAFDYFLVFLRSVWTKIKDAFSWLKSVLAMIMQFLSGGSVGGTMSSGFASLVRGIGGRQPKAITMSMKMD